MTKRDRMRTMKKSNLIAKVFIASICAFPLASHAQSTLPEVPDDLWQYSPTVETSISKTAKLGDFEIVFEKTTLADVAKTVGTGKIIEGDVENTLCYLMASDAKNDIQLRISSGENSGLEIIDAIDLSYVSKTKPPKNCVKLPAKFLPASFDRGLKLGIDDANVKLLYGNPSGKVGNWVIYSHTHMVDDAEETGTITIRYNKGKADYIGLVKTTSE